MSKIAVDAAFYTAELERECVKLETIRKLFDDITGGWNESRIRLIRVKQNEWHVHGAVTMGDPVVGDSPMAATGNAIKAVLADYKRYLGLNEEHLVKARNVQSEMIRIAES